MTTSAGTRERMANQLLMRGWATMKEILTASFGEWPPKGLDINSELQHGQKVELKPFVEDEALGDASHLLADERIIRLSLELCEKSYHEDNERGLNATLGHEAIHILQGDHYLRSAGTGKLLAFIVRDFIGLRKSSEPDRIMRDLTGHTKNISKEFNEALTKGMPAKKAEELVQHVSYLRKGIEVQARLHEIMMEGYNRWGKLPATRDELWAALSNAGITPPVFVLGTPGIFTRDMLDTFLQPHFSLSRNLRAATELETISASLSEKGQKKFWNETLPKLYADLIEMYGDKPGRARFGLGQNPKNKIPLNRFPGQKSELS